MVALAGTREREHCQRSGRGSEVVGFFHDRLIYDHRVGWIVWKKWGICLVGIYIVQRIYPTFLLIAFPPFEMFDLINGLNDNSSC